MKWKSQYYLSTLIAFCIQKVASDFNSTFGMQVPSQILSRRKRYLTFPEGSTLQLVFCLQTSAVITVGDIFLFGNTAALAWTLPSDPDFVKMFKEYDKLHTGTPKRRQDIKEIYYLDADGKVIKKVPYKRKPIINPVFSKRSTDEQNKSFKDKLKLKLDKMKMHKKQNNRDYLIQGDFNEKSLLFHRTSRVRLYEKLEKLFLALGHDGRQCVLYKLCESSRGSHGQGSFLHELARVIFMLPKGKEFEAEEHKDYDKAHHHSIGDCSLLYPGCEQFILHENM